MLLGGNGFRSLFRRNSLKYEQLIICLISTFILRILLSFFIIMPKSEFFLHVMNTDRFVILFSVPIIMKITEPILSSYQSVSLFPQFSLPHIPRIQQTLPVVLQYHTYDVTQVHVTLSFRCLSLYIPIIISIQPNIHPLCLHISHRVFQSQSREVYRLQFPVF